MTGISSLSGYVMTQDREMLAVAILINEFAGPAEKYRKIEDESCLFSADFPDIKFFLKYILFSLHLLLFNL